MENRLAIILPGTLLLLTLMSMHGMNGIVIAEQELYAGLVDPVQGIANDDPLDSDVSIIVDPYNPPINIPAGGGSFEYSTTVENRGGESEAFNVWTMVNLPNGRPYGPVFGPVEFLLPPGWSASRDDITQDVPGYAPAGTYTYIANVGIYPDEPWDQDSFVFEKLPESIGWYSQSPGVSYIINNIDFPDANSGWAVGSAWDILHTTNGGDTWYSQDFGQPYPQSYHDLSFVDDRTGWVVGNLILRTTDAGVTWVEQVSDYDYPLYGVSFVDASTGWAVGGYIDIFGGNEQRVIEHTTNGGNTWNGQLLQFYEYPLSSVHFVDPENGWAIGPTGAILHTENGGDTWAEQTSGTFRDLQAVHFVDPNTGWCVGENSTVLHTEDGGDNWYPQNPALSADLRGVYFLDSNTGWISGVNWSLVRAVILHTTDGGDTWYAQDTGIEEDEVILNDIHFVDADLGWAAGSLWPSTGVMLHTETGGD